jgi:hypothetical protein
MSDSSDDEQVSELRDWTATDFWLGKKYFELSLLRCIIKDHACCGPTTLEVRPPLPLTIMCSLAVVALARKIAKVPVQPKFEVFTDPTASQPVVRHRGRIQRFGCHYRSSPAARDNAREDPTQAEFESLRRESRFGHSVRDRDKSSFHFTANSLIPATPGNVDTTTEEWREDASTRKSDRRDRLSNARSRFGGVWGLHWGVPELYLPQTPGDR